MTDERSQYSFHQYSCQHKRDLALCMCVYILCVAVFNLWGFCNSRIVFVWSLTVSRLLLCVRKEINVNEKAACHLRHTNIFPSNVKGHRQWKFRHLLIRMLFWSCPVPICFLLWKTNLLFFIQSGWWFTVYCQTPKWQKNLCVHMT